MDSHAFSSSEAASESGLRKLTRFENTPWSALRKALQQSRSAAHVAQNSADVPLSASLDVGLGSPAGRLRCGGQPGPDGGPVPGHDEAQGWQGALEFRSLDGTHLYTAYFKGRYKQYLLVYKYICIYPI